MSNSILSQPHHDMSVGAQEIKYLACFVRPIDFRSKSPTDLDIPGDHQFYKLVNLNYITGLKSIETAFTPHTQNRPPKRSYGLAGLLRRLSQTNTSNGGPL